MLNCISTEKKPKSTPLVPIKKSDYPTWYKQQNSYLQAVADNQSFGKKVGGFLLDYHADGELAKVYLLMASDLNPYQSGVKATHLPQGNYHLDCADEHMAEMMILAWGYNCYRFERYKKAAKMPVLQLDDSPTHKLALSQLRATFLVRDLINTPTDDLGPTELAAWADDFAKQHKMEVKHTVGDELLENNFPSIMLVGRASHKAPRLIELNWGDKSHKKVTLVGKGVCFDTGGNNMKAAQFMRWMKKDMGGAAHALGLAQLIIEQKLPICLQVLIPTVENAVAGNAFRQGDILTTRSGQTVEIGHTDAEGRLILSDTLTYACEQQPDLIIDFATLTGAARVALGPTLTPIFSNREAINQGIKQAGDECHDAVWPMPLFQDYNKYIKSSIADLCNAASIPQAGCVTAALYLQHFVEQSIDWVHVDTYGWNFGDRTGGIEGGEALSMHAIFNWLKADLNQ